MAQAPDTQPFNILIVAQDGRLAYEAAVFAASLRHFDPEFPGELIVAEPQPGPLWPRDPRMSDPDLRALLRDLGARIVPLENVHFGQSYPNGNKIEALTLLPEGAPFVFFDSDTLVTAPLSRIAFDFDRPAASMRREGTWPQPELYGPTMTDIWRALYDRFGLDFESSLDTGHPEDYWQRYLYFNAGYFLYRCPHEFHALFLRYALEIRDNPPPEVVVQPLYPWLDQIALPLVIHTLGGGRETHPAGHLDGDTTCHYRKLPLLYARESDEVVEAIETVLAPNKIKKVVKAYEPLRKMVFQRKGAKVRALFDQSALPRREQIIRNRIKRAGLWMR